MCWKSRAASCIQEFGFLEPGFFGPTMEISLGFQRWPRDLSLTLFVLSSRDVRPLRAPNAKSRPALDDGCGPILPFRHSSDRTTDLTSLKVGQPPVAILTSYKLPRNFNIRPTDTVRIIARHGCNQGQANLTLAKGRTNPASRNQIA
jgi:hypothetical protein